MRDPIVEEVRNAREAHARAFDYDLAAICKDLKRIESECGHPVVSRSPRLLANSEDVDIAVEPYAKVRIVPENQGAMDKKSVAKKLRNHFVTEHFESPSITNPDAGEGAGRAFA